MRIKTAVGCPDQAAVKSRLRLTRFVPGAQKNGPAPRIESEDHSPNAVRRLEAQLFHVRVSGNRSETRQDPRLREQFILDFRWPRIEFGFEFVSENDGPFHPRNSI